MTDLPRRISGPGERRAGGATTAMHGAVPLSAWRRGLGIAVLVVAGEAAFALPFHVARFFRPTLLAGLGISNTELGAMFSLYGVVAALCYFPGGILADRFPARRLMGLSMALTGLGGLGLALLPGLRALLVIYACFGLTTILLFWAALIRATRTWGGPGRQGAAFGALDGGRGLFAAALASLASVPFRAALAGDPAAVTTAQRLHALQGVFLLYTAATFAAAALVWWVLVDEVEGEGQVARRVDWRHVAGVLARPQVWSQALIVFAAYCAYKGIDNYSLYLMHAYGMDEAEASQAVVRLAWIRPLAALAAGLLADAIRPTRAALLGFVMLLAAYGALAWTAPAAGVRGLVVLSLAVTCAAAFGLRGVYFAIVDEARVPVAVTGTAVGLISVIGFLPEILVAPLTGWLLDRSPGLAGHHDVFVLLAAMALTGLVATALLIHQLSRSPHTGR